jgi:hypothetical protein
VTATLRAYSRGVVERGDRTFRFGSEEPVKEVTITGDHILTDDEVEIPAGQTVTLWEYSASDKHFELLRFCIADQAGYVDLYWLVDKPTDAAGGDYSASGTCERWNQCDLTCTTDFCLNTDAARVNPVLADATGTTSTLPTMIGDAGTVEGKVYKVVAHNRGASDVILNRTRIN